MNGPPRGTCYATCVVSNWPSDLRDLAKRAALVSATGQGSREPRVNAATAAAWRRHLRAHLALPLRPGDRLKACVRARRRRTQPPSVCTDRDLPSIALTRSGQGSPR